MKTVGLAFLALLAALVVWIFIAGSGRFGEHEAPGEPRPVG